MWFSMTISKFPGVVPYSISDAATANLQEKIKMKTLTDFQLRLWRRKTFLGYTPPLKALNTKRIKILWASSSTLSQNQKWLQNFNLTMPIFKTQGRETSFNHNQKCKTEWCFPLKKPQINNPRRRSCIVVTLEGTILFKDFKNGGQLHLCGLVTCKLLHGTWTHLFFSDSSVSVFLPRNLFSKSSIFWGFTKI